MSEYLAAPPEPSQQAALVELFLDGSLTPFATYHPPAVFSLDTRTLEDGPHTLQIRATDTLGKVGRRSIAFTVQNGPGITLTGLREGSLVGGTVEVAVNAFGGEEPFDPHRAESLATVPVWVWVMCSLVVLWAAWYAIEFFPTPQQFANTATYAANPAALAAQPAPAGANAPPAFSGKGSAGGFDYAASGATVFTANCASCHGAGGTGVPGVFPPLVNDPVVTAKDPAQHVTILLKGLQGKAIGGKPYSGQMPSFPQLSDADIAAVIDHERTSWGNQAPIVTPDAVKQARGH
ncbi:MAG: cytochrome [Candidatus Eremiobacteraeota bacterium]|nr:cytochrome [Candidatus Eremiobacteraeota bacterium]